MALKPPHRYISRSSLKVPATVLELAVLVAAAVMVLAIIPVVDLGRVPPSPEAIACGMNPEAVQNNRRKNLRDVLTLARIIMQEHVKLVMEVVRQAFVNNR
jgi:hypothetical protein